MLDDAKHRAWFDGVMEEMGGTMHGAKGDDGALLATRTAPDAVMSARWSRDGTRLLGSCMDRSIDEWDVRRDDEPAAAILDAVARAVPYRLVDGRLEAYFAAPP